ncbi:hypothetical protein CJJ07_002732 [Candidozyma auris]|nr:hypothetical protein CJJ07_002732 [[Candida] auris]QEL62615.1 hypothetical protein CJJ09_004794 [[Candida] auris]
MHHANYSSTSLNDHNLYEISIGSGASNNMASKKKLSSQVKRVTSMSSLPSLSESKRPGEYYIQKINQSSLSLNAPKTPKNTLPPAEAPRPYSGPYMNSDLSNGSNDDSSSDGSSQFDCPDSRLSSLTSNSMCSNRGSHGSHKSDSKTPNDSAVHDDTSDEALDEVGQMNSSISTITLRSEDRASSFSSTSSQKPLPPVFPKRNASSSSSSDLTNAPGFRPGAPKLRSVSTSMLPHKISSSPSSTNALHRVGTSSSYMLTRSKTRYYNPKETKERKQLRKKLYDDNDDDDEILPNDLDLVFNVPVIKNHAEIYMSRRGSSSSSLSRKDLVNADDDKFNSFNTAMKPCPLPGKLSHANLSVETSLPTMDEREEMSPSVKNPKHSDDEFDPDNSFSFNNDSEISNNISDFYNQRSMSYSKLVKESREQQMIYKLPNYIKSQTSVDDLSLFSPEKLEAVDQSRPINLPPKNTNEKSKHTREFYKFLSNYELNTKHQSQSRKRSCESFISNQQSWFKLMVTVNEPKEFTKKLSSEKNQLRKLNWESLISDRFRFDYFKNVLAANLGPDAVSNIEASYKNSEARYAQLSDKMIANKDCLFDRIIKDVLQRPLFKTFMVEAASSDNNFNFGEFNSNFKYLLYMLSLSEGGLKKHHEVFFVPVFLILFQSHESVSNIYVLIEMFDKAILTDDVVADINKYLGRFSNLSNMSSSSMPYKILSKFQSLDEFEYLNFTSFFDIMIQLNDKLPLSLSAPSTPIVSQGAFGPLSSAKHSAEFSEQERGSTSGPNSMESLSDLDMRSNLSSSSSMSLIGIFLQLLVIYSNSPKSKNKNISKMFQGFLLTIFKYYHINWNSYSELIKANKSIKLNNSSDQTCNLESFLDKWKDIFNKM